MTENATGLSLEGLVKITIFKFANRMLRLYKAMKRVNLANDSINKEVPLGWDPF